MCCEKELSLCALHAQAWRVCFLLLGGVLLGSLALCVFVASNFRSGRFPFIWPIKARCDGYSPNKPFEQNERAGTRRVSSEEGRVPALT